MIKIRYPKPLKLVIGMISGEEELFVEVKEKLVEKYGEIDFESSTIPFIYTNYYREEMGEDLKRKFISFKHLIDPESLILVKLFTINLEKKFLQPNTLKRKINIDPGYISLSKLVLATTKNFSHRIYLGKGIYAEVTLRYQKNKGFKPWEWTYPDYRTEEYLNIFNYLRQLYKKQLEEEERYGKENN